MQEFISYRARTTSYLLMVHVREAQSNRVSK